MNKNKSDYPFSVPNPYPPTEEGQDTDPTKGRSPLGQTTNEVTPTTIPPIMSGDTDAEYIQDHPDEIIRPGT